MCKILGYVTLNSFKAYISVLGSISYIYKFSISFNTEQSLCKFYHEVSWRKIFLLAIFYHLLTIYFSVGDYCLSNTTKYPGEKIFLLAIFYHLLTIYFGVGDYCSSNSPTSCLFSSQSSSLYWLKSADTDKTITPNRSTTRGL